MPRAETKKRATCVADTQSWLKNDLPKDYAVKAEQDQLGALLEAIKATRSEVKVISHAMSISPVMAACSAWSRRALLPAGCGV